MPSKDLAKDLAIAPNRADLIGLWAATLSIAEVGVGSFMHALHIPLTGTFLSLNQAAFLTRLTKLNQHRDDARGLAFDVSTVTALIKSFSPIGKRLTPMLAISVQGLLFNLGLWIFGVNIVGALIGSFLLSAWGILQPAILAGIMYRSLSLTEQERMIGAWQKILGDAPWLSHFDLTQALLILFAIKCLFAFIFVTVAWRSSTRESSIWGRWERVLNRSRGSQKILSQSPKSSSRPNLVTTLRLAIKDLKSPMIWVSLAILLGLSLFLDSDYHVTIWLGMRALIGVYLFYVALRLVPWDDMLRSNSRIAAALRHAVNALDGSDRNDVSNMSVERNKRTP